MNQMENKNTPNRENGNLVATMLNAMDELATTPEGRSKFNAFLTKIARATVNAMTDGPEKERRALLVDLMELNDLAVGILDHSAGNKEVALAATDDEIANLRSHTQNLTTLLSTAAVMEG